ncbi:PAS-domain containing protein [Planktotalea sp.]|uniref:PAS-domain containing protein n=1 Tax=Planktotalea sp. TaxID=2029877 RepID=UPI003D6B8D45
MLSTLTLLDLGIIVLVSLATLALLALCYGLQSKPMPSTDYSAALATSKALTFDFDLSNTLVCTNEAGTQFLEDLELLSPDWPQFRAVLSNRFSDLPVHIAAVNRPTLAHHASKSIVDPMELELERHENGLTICIRSQNQNAVAHQGDLHAALSSMNILDLILSASEHAPFPVWQTLGDGTVGWSNARYRALDELIEPNVSEPDRPLFDLPALTNESTKPVRLSLKDDAHNRLYWFDVSRHPFKDGCLNFAMDIHAVVNAESAQRNFVQTLTKTFAHLATGLAIFDRNRQLVLFNPSLIDLTEMRPEFLIARPNLFSFFDQLRNNNVMPEPKSYANWRERIADVVTAASDDNFSETWHLPNGLTYRVTGRPHPDGAIAFLFEDISAEISLTRRFRAEAEVTRSALDALEDGIAIFNSAGFLQQSNCAMERFLELGDDRQLEQLTAQDITRLWQARCKPSPVWGEIRDFVSGNTERAAWSAEIHRKDGQRFYVKISPLSSGATLVTLSLDATAPLLLNKEPSKKRASETVAA